MKGDKNMFKAIIIGIIVTVIGLIALTAVNSMTTAKVADTNTSVNGYAAAEVISENTIKVEIEGEVNHPGEYSISSDDTLASLIGLAGGVTAKADPKSYDENLVIGTHTSFYIAPISETPSMCVETNITKVNINTADENKLVEISFTSSQASNLISYRIDNGPFKAIEEIMNVKGIGVATFNKVKNKISLTD